jgi:hypothetical protein
VNFTDFKNIIFEFLDLKNVLLDTKTKFLYRLGAKILDKYTEMAAILNFKIATIER